MGKPQSREVQRSSCHLFRVQLYTSDPSTVSSSVVATNFRKRPLHWVRCFICSTRIKLTHYGVLSLVCSQVPRTRLRQNLEWNVCVKTCFANLIFVWVTSVYSEVYVKLKIRLARRLIVLIRAPSWTWRACLATPCMHTYSCYYFNADCLR